MNEFQQLREQAGMSKRALARALGVSRQAIQRFEGGLTPVPVARLEQVRALAAARP